MMLFSVLMSIYKNDKVDEVANALDSILNQSCKPAQIVLVLDGPISDDLKKTVNSFANKNSIIEVVALNENVGLGKALNIGLGYCKYDWVARMDSDDYSLPDRFEKQVNYLQEHPDIDVLGGQIDEYDSTMTNKLAIRKVPVTYAEIVEQMKRRNAMNHVTVMYRKTSVLDAGNYQHCPYFEDYYLWCRMIKKGYQFHNLKDVIVNVRTGAGMYQRRGGKIYNDAIVDFQKKVFKLGFINKIQYLTNLIIRLSVANMPNFFRGTFYQIFLRGKK